MKKFWFLLLCLVAVVTSAAARELQAGTEYFIVHNVYDKVLGSNADGTAPALSEFLTNEGDTASYIFVAEESGRSGYVLLRQKSTGRYLAASTSNNWSVVFKDERGTSDEYCWKADEGLKSKLVNRRNTNRQLGIDGGKMSQDYVSVYYNKIRGSHASFRILPVPENSRLNTAERNYVSDEYVNEIGRKEIDYHELYFKSIDRKDTIDIHITSNSTPITGAATKVNLGSFATWLIFDNIMPSDVINDYLANITINGQAAEVGTNCRVAIYLNGAAVIPTRVRSNLNPLETYTDKNCEGSRVNYAVGNKSTLGSRNNTIRSFILHRGYMLTVASGQGGEGYSRVYVADHSDLVINDLPQALDQRISSIFVREWQYVSKKGWCSTTGQGANETEARKMRATWFYTWSADRKSTANLEYIPIRQHIYWPSMSTIKSYTTSSANLSFNEPDHSEQHDNCDCGGVISAWKACTKTPDFQQTGARIGSPAPTDAGWLSEYAGHVNDMAYRCDFVAFHAYWGTNEAADAQAWYNKLKNIYKSTGRPIWITEWNNGASWTTESWPSNWSDKLEKNRKAIQEIVEMLDTASFVERYAVYNWDTNYRAMINWDDGYVQPAGQVYRDNRSTFAYNAAVQKVPNWWAPAAKTPSLRMLQNDNGTINFTIINPNTDLTASIVIEHMGEEGIWTPLVEVKERYKYDDETINVKNVKSEGMNFDTDRFRVTVTTLLGKTISSGNSDLSLLKNPDINATSKSSVEGWTCSKDAANGYTKSTGDTYLEVWDADASKMNFNYYQDVSLDNGIYRLSANVFNYIDGQIGEPNGAVGLYAQTGNQLYFAPVTDNDSLNIEKVTTIERIMVTDGKVRVGIRNLGTMNARWAGADNFLLVRTGTLEDVDTAYEHTAADMLLYKLMPAENDTTDAITLPRDATRFIVNPDANRQTNFGWTASNVEFKTDAEAYDGVATNTYWNIWNGGAYTSTISQTIDCLPEGDYSVSAIVRGSKDAASIQLRIGTPPSDDAPTGLNNTRTVIFNGNGANQYPGSPYPQGWQLIETEPLHIPRGTPAIITLFVEAYSSAWWSADHFGLKLVAVPEDVVGIKAPQTTKAPSTSDAIYDLSGRRVFYPALKSGIYIIGGKKVYIK